MLTAPMIERMGRTQIRHTHHKVLVGRASREIDWTADTGDRSGITYDTEPTPCGFQNVTTAGTTRKQAPNGSMAPMAEAVVRFRVGVDISNIDRVKLVEAFGRPIDDGIEWEVNGAPSVGPSASLVNLKQLTGESVR